jgi:hypothetical protein
MLRLAESLNSEVVGGFMRLQVLPNRDAELCVRAIRPDIVPAASYRPSGCRSCLTARNRTTRPRSDATTRSRSCDRRPAKRNATIPIRGIRGSSAHTGTSVGTYPILHECTLRTSDTYTVHSETHASSAFGPTVHEIALGMCFSVEVESLGMETQVTVLSFATRRFNGKCKCGFRSSGIPHRHECGRFGRPS